MKVSREESHVHAVLGALLLVLVAGAFLFALYAMNGPVRVVQVSGDLTPAERAAVRNAVVGALDRSYLTLDLDALVAQVEALSWPHDVRVRRTWPAGVSVQVSKEVVVARWGGGGALNSEGAVIETIEDDLSGLPLLDCSLASGARAMQVYQALVDALAGRALLIAALRENTIGEWSLTLAPSLTVALGGEDVLGRLERFLAVYDTVLADRFQQVESVDARYRNGVAVNWRSGDDGRTGHPRMAVPAATLAVRR